jgi:hypothetical protein
LPQDFAIDIAGMPEQALGYNRLAVPGKVLPDRMHENAKSIQLNESGS